MLVYVLRRILYIIPIGLGVSLVCFLLVHLAPGDPLSAIVPADAPPEVVERMRIDLGYDKPIPVQYALWLGRALQGDLGRSVATGQSVSAEVFGSVGNTLLLASIAASLALIGGITLGALAGWFQGGAIDKLATALAVTGISIPHYWLGMVLVIIFSVELRWLPAVGIGPGGSTQWVPDWQHLRHTLLPAITLAAIPLGIVMRSTRAAVGEVLSQEFVQALRARGLPEVRVLMHVARNIAPTVLAVMGLQLGYLLGGSILIETVFSWPGTGYLLNTAIFRRDIPVLQGTILVLAMFFVCLNVLVDVLQSIADPRIRR